MMALNQVEEDQLPEVKRLFDTLKAAERPLHDDSQLSWLSAAARMTKLCSEHDIPLQAIDSLASLMKDMSPEGDKIKEAVDTTKLLLTCLKLVHKEIAVCPNECMLFWKEAEDLENCSICKEDRFVKNSKNEPIPKKVLIYFPITPRLQRLYASNSTAKQMRWSSEDYCTDGSMAHPCHGEAWKHFNAIYPEFAAEPRNVRLGLYTDGFYPFGKGYSCWPVVLAPYNLPPRLCMTNPFMFISLIIPGPKSPKEKLDMYLQPLIEELKQLWYVGTKTYDVFKKQNFNMRAAIMWTISDFSTYGMLSGWRTKGKLACPYCLENTKSFALECDRKETWFGCHRQFLPDDHVFRKNKSFSGKVDYSPPPPRLTGDQLWDRVSKFPKTTDCSDITCLHGMHNWTKQSIFWELPYWRKLLIRHSLDVMDIELHFINQLIHTMVDDKGKSVDYENARTDLSVSCKRRRQHLDDTGMENESCREIVQVPPYILNKEKRKVLCKWIKQLKFPDGYPSNLSKYVSVRNDKLLSMKSHDSHVFMERLLPVALRELLPVNVWEVITELSQFFRDISCSVLQTNDMLRLEKHIPEIICKLERIFPPTFFGVAEHMSVHLPYEAKVGGPVQYRWRNPFERFLHHFKGKVGTKAHVESSICDAYLTEEISNFCDHYVKPHLDTMTRNVGCNVESFQERGDAKIPYFFNLHDKDFSVKQRFMDCRVFSAAHRYVLANCDFLKEYERLFEQEKIKTYLDITASDVWSKFDDQFPEWFRKHILDLKITPDNILWSLAMKPRRDARKYNRYFINGYNFHTYAYGKNRSTMNYGVCVKDADGVERYGILQEVIELTYIGDTSYRTTLFKCEWFETGNNINVHPLYKLVEVNFTKKQSNYGMFVLPQLVHQVYFTPYPSIKNDKDEWWAVFRVKTRSRVDAPINQVAFQEEGNKNIQSLSKPNEDDVGKSDKEDGDERSKEESEDSAEFISEAEDELMIGIDDDNNDAGKGETESEPDYDINDGDQDESDSQSDSCGENDWKPV